MKTKCLLSLVFICFAAGRSPADDITTLDGTKYENVSEVALQPKGLYFIVGSGDSMQGVTVPYANLPDDIKENTITILSKSEYPMPARINQSA